MTGLASMLSNCPKAEKDRAELPDSLSSDLILTRELAPDNLLAAPELLVQLEQSLPELITSRLGSLLITATVTTGLTGQGVGASPWEGLYGETPGQEDETTSVPADHWAA